MEYELLRNQLQNTRNLLTTLAGNIDNTLLTFNEINRNNYRNRTTAARRNLNNLFQELRNMYPETRRPTTTDSRSDEPNNSVPNNVTNSNITNNYPVNNPWTSSLNNIINNRLNNLNSTTSLNATTPLNANPDLIEVTLYNNGNRVASNMEDVQIYPSLRTLRSSSTVHMYRNLETQYESCTICRENFEENSIVRKLNCGHIFHLNCIDEWLESNIRCPVCRNDLRDNDDEDEPHNNHNVQGIASV